MNIFYIISTILFFGLLGGLINAIRNNKEKAEYWKSLIKGVGASSLVPLFLVIIKSDICIDLGNDFYDYLIFGGLCLVFSILLDRY